MKKILTGLFVFCLLVLPVLAALEAAKHPNLRFTTVKGGTHNIGEATTNAEGLWERLFAQSL